MYFPSLTTRLQPGDEDATISPGRLVWNGCYVESDRRADYIRCIRGKALILLALVLVGGIAVTSAGGAPQKHVTKWRLRVQLPAPGNAGVAEVEFKITSPRGHVARVPVFHTTNNSALPEGIRAVVYILSPAKRTRTILVDAHIMINNLTPTPSRRLADAPPSFMDETVTLPPGTSWLVKIVKHNVETNDCKDLVTIDNDADTPEGNINALGLHGALQALRDANIQPSDPEAVLDHVIFNLCASQGAEEPDDGPG